MAKNRKWHLLFALYCVAMLLLLFNRPGYVQGTPYWEQVRSNLNLIPFRTIKLYAGILADGGAHLTRVAKINLYGNVVMFIPLGLLLPLVSEKFRGLRCVLMTTALVITLVELIQLFTLVGSCDIDDLILNLIGAALGFGIYRILIK